MARVVVLVVCLIIATVWIIAIEHNQPDVGPNETSYRQELTTVAGPQVTVTPTVSPTVPSASPTPGS